MLGQTKNAFQANDMGAARRPPRGPRFKPAQTRASVSVANDRQRARPLGGRTDRWWPSRGVLALALLLGVAACPGRAASENGSFAETISATLPQVVKIHGSGGLKGLEAYQSGFLISSEGHVLTVWSYVLDAEEHINVVLDDGSRHPGTIVNHDPTLEIAILKIDATELPHFNLDEAVPLEPGSRVLAFSNLFGIAVGGEPASVQHGHVAAIDRLAARRGAFKTLYSGRVYFVDAMTNNPGAAGGALTDRNGRLAGILGKELRNALDNTWVNYAIPVAELTDSVQGMLAGHTPPRHKSEEAQRPANPHTLRSLGIILIPDILAKTPAFVDKLLPRTPAEQAGLKPDDLVLFVNDRMVSSCTELANELAFIDRIDPVQLTVQRDQQLVRIEIEPQK
ncbi:MAG: S1C family serine protease [Planctomycetota bacterium]